MSENAAGGVLGTNMVAQVGLLVNDIERTSEAYAAFFGVPKPEAVWTDAPELAQTEFEGRPSAARAKLAFFRMGNLQLELIEPDETPSTWRNHLNERGEGVHHIAFVIDGMREKTEALGAMGFPLQQKGEYAGGRYAYIDTTDALKVLVELLENDKK